MQSRENITILSNQDQHIEERNKVQRANNSEIGDKRSQQYIQTRFLQSDHQKIIYKDQLPAEMIQREAQNEQKFTSQFNGFKDTNFQQNMKDVQIQKQRNNIIMNNPASQPCEVIQLGKKFPNQVSQSNTTFNSLSINNNQIIYGINSQFTISEQFQTLSNTEHSSQNGYFGSVQVIGNGNSMIEEQNCTGDYVNKNYQNMYQQNENSLGGNIKSLDASNYSYRGGQQIECPRIEYFSNQQQRLYNQSNVQSQQKYDAKVQEEHKSHQKNYDSILENLGRKIENIAKIAKESEKHDIEIKKYISNENSFVCMLNSPNKQAVNNSDSKDFQNTHFFQDTDNKSSELNNQLTNRSNNNLTSRTNGQSISTIYNLNTNNINNPYHNNSCQSLPLTERDQTFGIQYQIDLPSHHQLANKNHDDNKINNISNLNDEGLSRADSSRLHYKEYPSGMMVIQNNLQKKTQDRLQIQNKDPHQEQVGKKLEDLLKNEGEDSDYIFYNMSVYEQYPHIYSQTKYVIFTQSDFEKIMLNSTANNNNEINQQQRILNLEETIVNLNKKQEQLITYQNEIITKNKQLREQNATLLRTLGNISTEKSTQHLKETYKLQQYQQNQVNQLKKQDLQQNQIVNEKKQTSQSYHISCSNQDDKRQTKLSTIGDNKENQLKINNICNNSSDQNINKTTTCSQSTIQLQTPNPKKQEQKAVNNSSSQFGSKAVQSTTQTKRQNERSAAALGESQYFSKESNNTFNTDHYTSCDIEENKSTEPAYGDSMRQKTEEEETIGINTQHARSIGSLMSIPSQKSILQNQSLNHQASISSINNVLSYQNDYNNSSSATIQGFINQQNQDSSRMIASQSGNNILVKNKPPIQPKHKGTILVKEFLQQDFQNSNTNIPNQNNSSQKINENISLNKDLTRVSSCDIVIEPSYNQTIDSARSQISTYNQQNDLSRNQNNSSIEKSMDNKKLSATKLLKSKIIMSQQNSQDQIQKQLQEKQHHLVEQLQSLTKNDDCQTVNTKLSSTNINQLNNQNSFNQNTTISSLTNGLTVNNNHILKISPSFLKNKVQQPNSSNNSQQTTLSTHSKSIDSYQMQQQQKKNQQENLQTQITSASPFTQGIRASTLAGKIQASLQQNPINYLNTSEQISISESSKNNKLTKIDPTQVNLKNKNNKTDNVKKSNLSNMNYHISGSIGVNQNNKNSNINNNSSITNASSQQNSSIEEFSSTSSRGKKGVQKPSTFYITGGANINEQQQPLSSHKVQTKGQSQMMTSFSQQMHSSQSSSFMNNDSIIPITNKTTMNNKFESVNYATSQYNSVTNESNKSNGISQHSLQNQQQSEFNQSQKMGQTTLLLKQITKSQPRQHSEKSHSNNSSSNTTNISNNNNPLNGTQQKITSHSLDKTPSNNNIQKQSMNKLNLQLNDIQNKQESQQNIINTNNLRVTSQKQSSPIKQNLEKRKSGSQTQRESDYNEKPFDLKHHILQNQKDNQDKLSKEQQNQNLIKFNEDFNNSQSCLEKRIKHTNSVPHFSSQNICGKVQTARVTGLDLKGVENRAQEPPIRQIQNIIGTKKSSVRPNSLNSGSQRHFTSLEDQSNQSDKNLKDSEYVQDQKQQIMTERIERDMQNQNVNQSKNQNYTKIRSLSKQGNSTVQVGDTLQELKNDQECNIF